MLKGSAVMGGVFDGVGLFVGLTGVGEVVDRFVNVVGKSHDEKSLRV